MEGIFLFTRRSIRLNGFDYSNAGTYFVTMLTHDRKYLFGQVINGRMKLNVYGNVVEREWLKTERLRPNVRLDRFIVMPDHFHAILSISACKGTARRALTREIEGEGLIKIGEREFGAPTTGALPTVIGAFKSAVTKSINRLRHTPGTPVWHRNYYERIIRNEHEFIQTRQYIFNNPGNVLK